jgi:hypothetical protein
MILDLAVGRTRAGCPGCHPPRRQDANRSHGLCHGKESHRRQHGRGPLDRVCSAIALLVRPVAAAIMRPGKHLLAEESGQLSGSGSSQIPRSVRCLAGADGLSA